MCRENAVDEMMLNVRPPPQPSEYQGMIPEQPPPSHAVPYTDVGMQRDLGNKLAELQRDGYTNDRWQPVGGRDGSSDSADRWQPVPGLNEASPDKWRPVGGLREASPDRWRPVGGLREPSPDASFRSHYSGYDERAVCDGMAWHSQDEVREHCLTSVSY